MHVADFLQGREAQIYRAWRAEAVRREGEDPLRAFVPTPKQQAFIDAVLGGPTYENLFFGANRSGKSTAGAAAGAHLFRFGIPARPAIGASGIIVYDRATSGWVVGPDYTTLQAALIPKYFTTGAGVPGQAVPAFIPAREIAHWDPRGQVLRGTNGSLVRFKSNEQSQVKFSAQGVDWIQFDEAPDYLNYEESTMRVEAGQRLRIFMTCILLPEAGAAAGVAPWLFERLVEPWMTGSLPRVQIFTVAMRDNPHLDPDEVARMTALYRPGTLQHRIRILGELLPGMAGDRIYPAFDPALHVREVPPVRSYAPLLWTWDFNIRPLVSLVLQAQEDGQVHVLDELVLDEGSLPRMVEAFCERYPAHPEVWIYGDANGGAQSHQTEKSSYTLIEEAMQRYPGRVAFRVPLANPAERDRVNALNMLLYDAEGWTRLHVAPHCHELRNDLLYVVADAYGKIKKIRDVRNPYSRRTHTSDALGYYAAREHPVRLRRFGRRYEVSSDALRGTVYGRQRTPSRR